MLVYVCVRVCVRVCVWGGGVCARACVRACPFPFFNKHCLQSKQRKIVVNRSCLSKCAQVCSEMCVS